MIDLTISESVIGVLLISLASDASLPSNALDLKLLAKSLNDILVVFFLPNIFSTTSKYVDLPLRPSPVKMNAVCNSLVLIML